MLCFRPFRLRKQRVYIWKEEVVSKICVPLKKLSCKERNSPERRRLRSWLEETSWIQLEGSPEGSPEGQIYGISWSGIHLSHIQRPTVYTLTFELIVWALRVENHKLFSCSSFDLC